MKKLLSFILSLTMVISLGACANTGSGGDGAQNSGDVSQQEEQKVTNNTGTEQDMAVTENEKDNLKWWQDTIVYEIYPTSFKDTDGDGYGDLKGIIEKLDHLRSLGVGAIWLTPVYVSPMVDNGYDVADYYDIDPRFGTMEDMEKLIAAADERGIRIVMDLVFNHTSDQNKWFLESKADREGDKSDWYIWKDGVNGGPPNNWRGIFGGSAWTWDEGRGQYYLHTFAKEQPDLNWENPDVRQALYDIANFWLDKGVGGFRIDAITYIKKPQDFKSGNPDAEDGTVDIHKMTANTPGIVDYIMEFKENVSEGRDIFTVAEANGVPANELGDWVGDTGAFNMLFEFSHANIGFTDSQQWCRIQPWMVSDLKSAINASQKATAENGWYPIFFENHDQPRGINRFFTDHLASGETISNTPDGEKLSRAAKAMAVLNLSLRGTPFIYEGQEIGMSNVYRDTIEEYNDIRTKNEYEFALGEGFSQDEALGYAQMFSRDNARSPMQWSDEENAGFTTGKPWLSVNDNYKEVNVSKEDKDSDSVLNWYRQLYKLRTQYDVFAKGDYKGIMDDSDTIFAFEREYGDEKLTVLINFFDEETEYDESLVSSSELLVSSRGSDSETGKLGSYEAVIFINR